MILAAKIVDALIRKAALYLSSFSIFLRMISHCSGYASYIAFKLFKKRSHFPSDSKVGKSSNVTIDLLFAFSKSATRLLRVSKPSKLKLGKCISDILSLEEKSKGNETLYSSANF